MATDSLIRRCRWKVIGFSLLGLLFLLVFWPSNPVRVTCKLTRLPCPPGKILHRKNAQGFFAGSSAFVFTASRREIEDWIARCRDREPKDGIAYTPIHYLVFKTGDEILQLMNSDEEIRFHTVNTHAAHVSGRIDKVPRSEYEVGYIRQSFPWFAPHITNGVRYDIPQNENADYGTILYRLGDEHCLGNREP